MSDTPSTASSRCSHHRIQRERCSRHRIQRERTSCLPSALNTIVLSNSPAVLPALMKEFYAAASICVSETFIGP